MVTPDGKSTMLGQWRVALRQAEDAARGGRIEEAIRLTSRPDVAEHHNAVKLRDKLATDLVGRAGRRAEADDIAGAIDDLKLAETLSAPPDALAAARLRLADHVAADLKLDLEAGEPGRVAERVEELAGQRIGGPALRRLREVADSWRGALDDARRGEFGRAHDQLDRAERLAGDGAAPALASARREVEARQKASAPLVEALYAALGSNQWGTTLAAAEALLEAVPEHPSARQARARAWQQIAAIAPSAAPLPGRGARIVSAGLGSEPREAAPHPASGGDAITFLSPVVHLGREPAPRPQPAPAPAAVPAAAPIAPARPRPLAGPSGPAGRFLLWVDAVGGYLVCLDDEVVLGRAGSDSVADVPLVGDLSRRHATLTRDGEGYVLRAIKPTYLNGNPVASAAPLKHGDLIRLGSSVELEFRQPSPVSSTARLAIVSRHRLPLAVEGVILMAETCIIGSSRQAHVPAPGLHDPAVLYRQGGGLSCRAAGPFEVDGVVAASRSPLTLRSSVLGPGFSFSLEPLGSHASPV